MNDPHDGSELPDLTDDEVRLLYGICHRANGSSDPPFKALFHAYDAILREEEIEQEHDGVMFRALLRVGESTAEANKNRQHVDLVERLEDLLETRGIVLDREVEQDEYAGLMSRPPQRKKLDRRVSFDDAGLDDTWLSQHSEAVNPDVLQAYPPHSLLSLPPRRARNATSGRRARSISSQRSVVRHPAPKKFQTSSSQDHLSEDDEPRNPTLHFEVSQTQLEINADAMLGISDLRLQRRTLHFLHDQSLQMQTAHKPSSAIAVAHDRRILLKQALETWRGALLEQRYERRHNQHFQHLERKADRARDLFLITKAFTHWATQCSDERFRTRIAQHYVLRAKYFKRWRAIAIENQAKIRRILCRKYIAIWREKTIRRSMSDEFAEAWYEERLKRRCKLSMFWEFCSRQVADNHDVWIKRRTLSQLRSVLHDREEDEAQAERLRDSRKGRGALQMLGARIDDRRSNDTSASRHYDRAISLKAIQSVKIRVRLTPLGEKLTVKIDLDLMRKALQIWHHSLELERHASAVRRRITLQNALTQLNDGFRCREICKRTDDRVQLNALYHLHLQYRLRIRRKVSDGKLLVRAFGTWRAKVSEERDQIEYAQAVFAEAQHRRRQRAGLVALNLAKRERDDARRAAVEFRNSRDVPQIFGWIREKHEHVQKSEKWADIAIFYRLGTRVLRTWNERTTEQKANRKRDAYARVRSRIKIRTVGACFSRWRGQAVHVRSMNDEAERRAGGQLVGTKAVSLARWRDRAATITQMEDQARVIDRGRLLRTALGALFAHLEEKAALQGLLEQSAREAELALLASALRRWTWQRFKAARNYESAEALVLRNRSTHAKQMLRHWAAQTAAKRLPPPPANQGHEEPDSPSLRPASRAASRAGASATTTPATLPPSHIHSSPPQRPGMLDSTPGYLRTPSRGSRRAGRFRPLLPTPAPGTPFAFREGYLATTPAPLALPSASAENDGSGMGMESGMEGLTPQVTPFGRKLRAGGFGVVGTLPLPNLPPSALRSSVFGGGGAASAGPAGGVGGGSGKSVRFAGSGGRFGGGGDGGRLKGS